MSKRNQFLLDIQHSCSVVDEFRAKTYHRVTEDTEVAQRDPDLELFVQSHYNR
jgi:hypothetical protein